MGSGDTETMIRIATLIALSTLSLAAANVPAKPIDEREVQKMARDAKTAEDHLTVAKHYEMRGRYFEGKAVKHEADADALASREGYNPMRHKWPAMAQAPIDKARAQGMQARRAAKESFERMAYHQDMAAKAGAAAGE